MILDDNDESDKADAEDEAEDASGHVDAGASLQNTLATSELASGRAKSIDTYNSWYDTEEGCWIDEPAPSFGY